MSTPKRKRFTVQISVTDALLSFEVLAGTLEEAIAEGKEEMKELKIFADGLDVIDYSAEVTGTYK